MKTRLFTKICCVRAALWAVLLTLSVSQSAKAAQIAQNFELPYYTNENATVQLSDYAGNIIVLEWFIHWCHFCQEATPAIKRDIAQYYQDRGGNPDGLPVKVIYLNLDYEAPVQTQNFIQTYGIAPVLDDSFQEVFLDEYNADGTPLIVVINGLTNSPSHQAWEVLYRDTGWPQDGSRIPLLRTRIDAVKAPTLQPRWSGLRRLSGGALEFTVAAQKGRTNYIECTTNLLQWTTVTNIVATTNVFTFRESNPASVKQRFYRVRVP